MANQPETATYDAGVYQLETADPVQGGVGGKSNQPLLNLANRTTWLKQQIDALNLAQGGNAPINSPIFTGSPAATTAPLGDNSTRIATTAFVQGTIGVFHKDVAGSGSVTLSAVEAGAGVLVFVGALTGARTINIPANPAREWTVYNATSGGFTLTVKTPAGTGVTVPQGVGFPVFSNGASIFRSDNGQVDRAGDTMLGFLTLAAAPTLAMHAATKDYVDGVTNNRVLRSGDTMTGPLTLPSAPSAALHAATKAYVDGAGWYDYNGWTQLPSGLIIQWGQTGRAWRTLSAAQWVSFPRTFPNACFVVIPMLDYDNAGLLDMFPGADTPGVGGVTRLAGITLGDEGTQSRAFGWRYVAIGI